MTTGGQDKRNGAMGAVSQVCTSFGQRHVGMTVSPPFVPEALLRLGLRWSHPGKARYFEGIAA